MLVNRYALLLTLPCLLLLPLCGCQRSTGAPGQAAQDEQANQAQVLAEIKSAQEQTARDLADMKQRQELEAREQAEPPVVRDLPVARAAADDAVKAVQSKNAEVAAAALKRLKRALESLAFELPGAIIARGADRALYDVQSQRAIGSKDFVDATLEIESAIGARATSGPAALVPDVLNDLEAAKKAVVAGNADDAIRLLGAIIERAMDLPAAAALSNALAAVRGAEEALQRQAWPVVAAELEEIDIQLAQVGKVVRPAVTTETQPETQTQPSAQPSPSTQPSPTPTPSPSPAVTQPPATSAPSATTQPPATPPPAS
jgi:hypothetical protein